MNLKSNFTYLPIIRMVLKNDTLQALTGKNTVGCRF